MSIVSVPQQAWYKTGNLDLTLPDDWKVEVLHMAGYDRPALKPDEIKAALDKPIDTPTVRELARGKKELMEMDAKDDVKSKILRENAMKFLGLEK